MKVSVDGSGCGGIRVHYSEYSNINFIWTIYTRNMQAQCLCTCARCQL